VRFPPTEFGFFPLPSRARWRNQLRFLQSLSSSGGLQVGLPFSDAFAFHLDNSFLPGREYFSQRLETPGSRGSLPLDCFFADSTVWRFQVCFLTGFLFSFSPCPISSGDPLTGRPARSCTFFLLLADSSRPLRGYVSLDISSLRYEKSF